MTYIMRADGVVSDPKTGEIVEPETNPDIVNLAIEYEQALGQRNYWQARADALKAELREYQRDGVRAYSGVVITVRSDPYETTDTHELARRLYHQPMEADDLVGLIGASKGFRKAEVPEALEQLVAACTETKSKAPSYTPTIARQAERFRGREEKD